MDELDHPRGESAMFDKGCQPVAKRLPDRPVVMPAKATRNQPVAPEQKSANRVIAGYRIVVERSMAQMNRFHVPRRVFRGRVENHSTRHGRVASVIAGIVNRRIEACPSNTYPAAARAKRRKTPAARHNGYTVTILMIVQALAAC